MVISGLIIQNLSGQFQARQKLSGAKTVNFQENGLVLKIEAPQLIGERRTSCYHRLYLSRKFCKKVMRTIFPNKIKGISASALKN
jgi:hypothetical protein